jgi:hypothetical protein
MRSNQHLKAVELYTCAIALNQQNAIYYCNRYGSIGETSDGCELAGHKLP